MADPIKAVAPGYPNTKFIQLYADPFTPPIPNVRTVEYQAHYGMFLAGLFGARITQSQKARLCRRHEPARPQRRPECHEGGRR